MQATFERNIFTMHSQSKNKKNYRPILNSSLIFSVVVGELLCGV